MPRGHSGEDRTKGLEGSQGGHPYTLIWWLSLCDGASPALKEGHPVLTVQPCSMKCWVDAWAGAVSKGLGHPKTRKGTPQVPASPKEEPSTAWVMLLPFFTFFS